MWDQLVIFKTAFSLDYNGCWNWTYFVRIYELLILNPSCVRNESDRMIGTCVFFAVFMLFKRLETLTPQMDRYFAGIIMPLWVVGSASVTFLDERKLVVLWVKRSLLAVCLYRVWISILVGNLLSLWPLHELIYCPLHFFTLRASDCVSFSELWVLNPILLINLLHWSKGHISRSFSFHLN